MTSWWFICITQLCRTFMEDGEGKLAIWCDYFVKKWCIWSSDVRLPLVKWAFLVPESEETRKGAELGWKGNIWIKISEDQGRKARSNAHRGLPNGIIHSKKMSRNAYIAIITRSTGRIQNQDRLKDCWADWQVTMMIRMKPSRRSKWREHWFLMNKYMK